MAPVAPFRLKMLGGFLASRAEGPAIGISARKTRALLAYLALAAGRPHSRDKLADLLWSDRGAKQARDSLRQALAELREALAGIHPTPLTMDHDLLALDPAAVGVDALEFERLAACDGPDELRRAVALYDGDLLDGLGARDPVFDDWLRGEHQHYRELALTALKKLLAHETGASAMAIAQRLLALDPLQEEGHRALMHFHAEAGDVAAALRQYDTCCLMLKRELDITPSPETVALHRKIKNQSMGRPDSGRDESPIAGSPLPLATTTSKPSLAVLPLRNLSGDAEQRYFSDGIAEDIITELSRFRSLFVIARNSSFQFRDEAVDVRRVARELGVQYVVEGSVRRVADHLRLTAQLVEATTGNHVWGERYDRNIAELFAVQDEVVQAIVARIAGELTIFEFDKARRKRTEHLAAYDCHLRGLDYWRFNSDEANIESTKWFEKALELDPDYAEPLARLSINTAVGAVESGSAEQLERAQTMANKAVALDPNNSWSHCALGLAKLFGRSPAASADHFQSAMRLNPNDPDQLIFCSTYYIYAGKFDAAREVIAAALRLNPLPPIWYNTTSGMLQYGLRRYADAALLFERMENNTACWHHYYLAACYERLGKSAEAKNEIGKALRLKPDLSIGFIKLIDPYARPDDLENLLEPLRKLGLPA